MTQKPQLTDCFCCNESFDCLAGLVLEGDHYCSSVCAREDGWIICRDCGEWCGYEGDRDIDGHSYCQECFDNRFFRCEECDVAELHRREYIVERSRTSYCEPCFNSLTVVCTECDGRELESEVTRSGRAVYCRSCAGSISRPQPRRTHWNETHETYEKVGTRRFGIELEFTQGDNSVRFDCITNGSDHCGYEYRSGIMYGDGGMETLRNFVEYAQGKGWDDFYDCGYHLHVDCGGLSTDQLKSIAYAYQMTAKFWESCVAPQRERCGYSDYNSQRDMRNYKKHLSRIESTYDFREWSGRSSRYQFINWQAYNKFQTVEVRGHEGTNDPDEVCNWIIAHTRFVDCVKDMTWEDIDDQFDGTAEFKQNNMAVILGSDVCDFYMHKHRRQHGQAPTLDPIAF